MNLNDVGTLQNVAQIYRIPVATLMTRLTLKSFNMVEGDDYKRLGTGQSILLSPIGIKKITKTGGI